jgi:hypothetical protein
MLGDVASNWARNERIDVKVTGHVNHCAGKPKPVGISGRQPTGPQSRKLGLPPDAQT